MKKNIPYNRNFPVLVAIYGVMNWEHEPGKEYDCRF